jgi:hypothetical protein
MAAPVTSAVPIDQRFAQLIKQFGLTKNSFAVSLGKTASVVQHLIDGRNKPGYDLLCKVFEIYPNVSRDWLLLGRGPMLVSGEPTPKPIFAPKEPTEEPPLEPIDLTDVELPASRRPVAGVAGSRLQPGEIAATLALAAAATQPARTVAPAPAEAPTEAAPPAEPFASVAATPLATEAAPAPEPATPVAPAPVVTSAPVAPPVVAPEIPAATLAPAVTVPNPEAYMSAALHAQHLQHQLAMAEMRNQHLLEQQQMLREMLAMARQAMV